MRLLFTYLKKHKKVMGVALVLATVNQVFSLLDPQIFRLIIDNYATQIDSFAKPDFISGIGLLILALIGTALISRIAKSFQDYFVNVTTERVGADLYTDGVKHIFSLPFSVFQDTRSGEVLGKLQKARQDAKSLLDSLINIGFLSLVGIVFVIVYAFIVNPIIGLSYTLLIPTLGTIIFFLSSAIKRTQNEIVRETVSLAGSTTETLRNVELVKSLGLESQEIKRLNENNDAILALEIKKVKTVRTLSFIQGTIINALRAGLLLLMVYFIFQSKISLGEFFSLWFYSFVIFSPLQQMGVLATNYQESKASMRTLGELLEKEKEEAPENPKDIGSIKSIEGSNINFSYDEFQVVEKVTISDIKFKASQGETIAFVGPSGSGKSTLLKLLIGLYKADSGSITYNNTPVNELDPTDLRSKIGYVSQETQLFSGTIRENLLFVSPEATDKECVEALNKSQAMSIIERGEGGLDTKVGEGGIKLSGGEKQRLAIARSLLRDPDVLIFDEATSSLDSVTERAITDTVRNISETERQRITVLVAHRLSTVIHADRIYVLEAGKVIEEGSHEALVKKGGLYYALWREQTGSNA
ncbi:MAG: ATP-binding cassette subfamily B protein [Candidatus Paceibacteria bacterium]|jgi:ATP-binding cassette subfamily B protein